LLFKPHSAARKISKFFWGFEQLMVEKIHVLDHHILLKTEPRRFGFMSAILDLIQHLTKRKQKKTNIKTGRGAVTLRPARSFVSVIRGGARRNHWVRASGRVSGRAAFPAHASMRMRYARAR